MKPIVHESILSPCDFETYRDFQKQRAYHEHVAKASKINLDDLSVQDVQGELCVKVTKTVTNHVAGLTFNSTWTETDVYQDRNEVLAMELQTPVLARGQTRTTFTQNGNKLTRRVEFHMTSAEFGLLPLPTFVVNGAASSRIKKGLDKTSQATQAWIDRSVVDGEYFYDAEDIDAQTPPAPSTAAPPALPAAVQPTGATTIDEARQPEPGPAELTDTSTQATWRTALLRAAFILAMVPASLWRSIGAIGRTVANHVRRWWGGPSTQPYLGEVLTKEQLRRRYPLVPTEAHRVGKGRSVLGRGCHGVAKLARQGSTESLAQHVVIKSQTTPSGDAQRRAGPWQEAALHRQLADVPHLIKLLDLAEGESRSRPGRHELYMVLEKGLPLQARDADEAARHMTDVLTCLQALHARSVYHRDIVSTIPSESRASHPNVVTKSDGRAYVIDMGKARVNPNALLRPIFEFTDARAAARLYKTLLKPLSPGRAAAFDRWYHSQPTFDMKTLLRHPDWAEHFGRAPKAERQGLVALYGRARFALSTSLDLLSNALPGISAEVPQPRS